MHDEFFLIGGGLPVDCERPTRKQRQRIRKAARGRRFSANLVVDIGNTCNTPTTIATGGGGLGTMSGQIGIVSGLAMPASGGIVGQSVNLANADTFCNLMVAGQLINGSGQLRIAVQCSDSDTSGNYTDPTSGLPIFPTSFSSGGILILNSGGLGSGVLGGGVSGQAMQSGFIQFAGFQRTQTFARAVVLSGDFYVGPLQVAFVSQSRTTGSGGGFTLSPSSGPVSV